MGGISYIDTQQASKQGAVTSIWELTISERQNAATIIENTNVRPFVYCRYYFKCFYCKEQYSDITALIDHTTSHANPDKATILKKLLPKGKRTLKVDISNLNCRLCQRTLTDLDATRQHLTEEHKLEFTESGHGIIGYNLTLQNGQFSCHLCKKIFQTFILLNRHMNVHFSNAICETCGMGFMTHQRLMQHKEIHLPGGYPCEKCKKVYTTSSNLKYHVEKAHEGATKMRMLRCPHCSERFVEYFRKLKHLKQVHGITFIFECEVCKSSFSTRRSLTMHTNKFHTQKTQCEICKKSFSCRTTLRKHMVSHTGERNFVCHLCQKAYRHQKSLKQHMRVHANIDHARFSCSDCGSCYTSRNDFNKHVKEWHPRSYFNFPLRKQSATAGIWEITVSERKNAATIIEHSTVRPFIFMGHTFKCFYCLQYFSEITKLLEHTSAHPALDKNTLLEKYITKNKRSLQVDISELKCSICHECFAEISDVKEHLYQRHDVKFYQAGNAMTGYHLKLQDGLFFCHICNEKFHTFSLLNNHMNTHVGKVVCENCGAGFLNQRLLIKHMEVHDVLKFPCKECDKVFSKKSQLRYHIEVKHKGKMVKHKKCPHCPFEFKEHYAKMVHLRDVHGITLSFECHICKASLPNRRMLTQHRTKFHTERFRCEVCSKCFGMRCHLVQHMRGHSGERTFVCPICKNAFMHRMTLAKHIKRVHGTDYKFICAECGAGFNLRGELSKHVKEWHAEKKID